MNISQSLPAMVSLLAGLAFLTISIAVFQSSPSRIVSSLHGTTIYIPEGAALEERNFEPQEPTVVVGLNNTVRWINQERFQVELIIDGKCEPVRDYDAMTVESSSIQVALKPGESFVCEFYMPGTYDVHTVPWPWMRGSVTALHDRP